MKIKEYFTDFRIFLIAGAAVITFSNIVAAVFGQTVPGVLLTFSNIVVVLFGQTVPGVVLTFFKDASAFVIMVAVFTFIMTWALRARPYKRPKRYSVVAYDVFGNECLIEGLRREFSIHDVAWSFMKQYKKSYPLHNFALVSDLPNSEKKTIFRYI
ncbi:MAG: hypothetical protein ACE5JT_00945 [Nitrosopumilaceae archaeon]